MSGKSKRRPPIPPRPNVTPLLGEQAVQELLSKYGGKLPHIFPRDFNIYIVHAVALQLEQLFVANERLPYTQASIEKRSDGFSLHVQVVEPSTEANAVVMG